MPENSHRGWLTFQAILLIMRKQNETNGIARLQVFRAGRERQGEDKKNNRFVERMSHMERKSDSKKTSPAGIKGDPGRDHLTASRDPGRSKAQRAMNRKDGEIDLLEKEVSWLEGHIAEKDALIAKIQKGWAFRISRAITAPFRLAVPVPHPDRAAEPDECYAAGKVAFVDHSFHRKSRATAFFIDLLKKNFEVEIFWDDAWQYGPRVDLKKVMERGFQTIVLFQVYGISKEEAALLKTVNLIVIPMCDGAYRRGKRFWQKFRHAKFISFSRHLHNKLMQYGLNSRYFQYFPNPQDLAPLPGDPSDLKGFFWQRTDQITWDHVRLLIQNGDFTRFHIHQAVDPPGYRFVMPTETEITKYRITFSEWAPSQKSYWQEMKDSHVFFAPRAMEGIGMAFIEAMAMGLCVVAPDCPTMNEYIRHGFNGLLYDPARIRAIDFSGAREIGRTARWYAGKGYQKWLHAEPEVLAFILARLSPGSRTSKSISPGK